jgi:hypothetical protein
MTTHINRQRATTRTRTAQALLGVLVIGGGMAMAVGLRPGSHAESPSGKPSIPDVDLGTKSGPARSRSLDTSGLADRLNMTSNAPKIVEVVQTTTGTEKEKPIAEPTQEMRYLGGVMGGRNMALISDNGKQRFVAVGDSLGGGTVESITDEAVRIAGNNPRTLDLVNRAGDSVTKGHAAARPQPGLRPAGPGSMAVVKQPQQPAGISLGNMPPSFGQEVPPVPEYINPAQVRRYEELRSEIRNKKSFGSEAEIAEYAAKILSTEDPNGVNMPLMEKQRASGIKGDAKGVKN